MEYDHLSKALQISELKNIQIKDVSKIGEGAWHTVYKIKRKIEGDLVVRIKKKVAYGQIQEYCETDLIAEYESTKIYYQVANKCYGNICPQFFNYFIDDSLVFTIESFMGKGKTLQNLEDKEAFEIGKRLGSFFQAMHRKKPNLQGFGDLIWNREHLEGKVQKEVNVIWQEDNDFYIEVLKKLISTNLKIDTGIVEDKILQIIEERRKNLQRVSLVNQDVTPENIILHLDNVSIIDPFPRLDFDIKYAGYFVFCYKFLLPAYSSAPRYQNNFYSENATKLDKIAAGFLEDYTNGNANLIQWIMHEYVLWVLLETYEHYEILNGNDISSKILQQMGDKEIIKDRLTMCLKELENICKS